MKQGCLATSMLAMCSDRRTRCCKCSSKGATHQSLEHRTFALLFHSFKFVGVLPDPRYHGNPILTTSHYLERLGAFPESVDVDDAARTRFEAQGTEKCVLKGRSADECSCEMAWVACVEVNPPIVGLPLVI